MGLGERSCLIATEPIGAKDSEREGCVHECVQVTKHGCTALIGLAKWTLGWFLLVLGLVPLYTYELAVVPQALNL